jgi:hypothetical protein
LWWLGVRGESVWVEERETFALRLPLSQPWSVVGKGISAGCSGLLRSVEVGLSGRCDMLGLGW